MTWILLTAAALLAISFLTMVGALITYIWTDNDTAYKVGMSAIIAVLAMTILVAMAVAMMSM